MVYVCCVDHDDRDDCVGVVFIVAMVVAAVFVVVVVAAAVAVTVAVAVAVVVAVAVAVLLLHAVATVEHCFPMKLVPVSSGLRPDLQRPCSALILL